MHYETCGLSSSREYMMSNNKFTHRVILSSQLQSQVKRPHKVQIKSKSETKERLIFPKITRSPHDVLQRGDPGPAGLLHHQPDLDAHIQRALRLRGGRWPLHRLGLWPVWQIPDLHHTRRSAHNKLFLRKVRVYFLSGWAFIIWTLIFLWLALGQLFFVITFFLHKNGEK